MPKRTDISSILIIGAGPIVIGQSCEFDYSGTQACKVLQAEGYRVILANSNPATIMTDPDFADATYIEPLTIEYLEEIIKKEKPDVLLPTLGGQTALNLAMQLHEQGILQKYNLELIGATPEAIETAENRQKFKEAMEEISLTTAKSGTAKTWKEAQYVMAELGLPVIIRPAYILGGKGTGIAATPEEFEIIARHGLDASPISEILIEQSIKGWKEFEMEVMRDHKDNCVIVCAIENIDPMGVHTGDSITVAPAQTLSDVEYQAMRDASFACLRRVGVETGGSNVQFAVNPKTGEQVIIEMNPRVSRSSALASKATGFPIAKIAALLAVGYTLDEIPNDITKKTPASFEPVIDYVVTKVPRWTFEKFPETPALLGTQMQSVGEVMAIGRTFPESLQKALRSLEQGRAGLNCDPGEELFDSRSVETLKEQIYYPTPERLYEIEALIRKKVSLREIHQITKIDPWFLHQIKRITDLRDELSSSSLDALSAHDMKRLKQMGFSDVQIAYMFKTPLGSVQKKRRSLEIFPTYKAVDTCAAEFAADTPYLYSAWEDENESVRSERKKVMILGSGPNRIGQGIEFDYACVHASFALNEAGYESIMYNCNPETVSTDYDTSDKLYFEPITIEDVQNVIELEKPDGIIVSLGGQTPLKLADELPQELVLGTKPVSIDRAEDRDAWNALCEKIQINQPTGGTATTLQSAIEIAKKAGYPVLIRPSYVLGGRAMRIVYSDAELAEAFAELKSEGSLGKEGGLSAKRPVLIDQFLEDAVEVDLDALRDTAGDFAVAGIMEHVDEAGIHSGDSACTIPTQTLSEEILATLVEYTRKIAEELEVVGLINIQFVVKDDVVYVIEANPRASRTVPFVAKAINVPIVKIATRIMLGETIDALKNIYQFDADSLGRIFCCDGRTPLVAVKEAVFPFNRFSDVDILLGPEMKSTGEVMGRGQNFTEAFSKSQIAAGDALPSQGIIIVTVADKYKQRTLPLARQLVGAGFELAATAGTADFLREHDVEVAIDVAKLSDKKSAHPNMRQLMQEKNVIFIINTPNGNSRARGDGYYTRKAALDAHIPAATSFAAARAITDALIKQPSISVQPLQNI